MTHGFQQQNTGLNFCIPKQAASAQHGQRSDKDRLPVPRQQRTFQPRPGH